MSLAEYEEMLKNYVPPVIAEEKSGLNGWAIAGIVGGGVVLVGAVLGGVLLILKKRRLPP